MSKKKKAKALEPEPQDHAGPEVIVDFIFREGEFHIAVANVSDAPAHNVSVKFDAAFRGLGGARDFSSLPLFRRLLFLAPRKSIETFLDTTSAYFARREPTRIAATITYRDNDGRTHERRIAHDLAVYKDIAYIAKRSASSASQPSPSMLRTGEPRIRESHFGSEKR